MWKWLGSRRAFVVLSLVLVVMILAGLAAWGHFLAQGRRVSGPTGTIFVTGTSDEGAPFLETYAVDVVDQSVARIGEDDQSLGNFYSLTPDGKFVTFIGATKDRIDMALVHQLSSGAIMQVYRAPVANHQLPLVSQKYQLTDDDNALKLTPAISDDGAYVAYVAASSSSSSVSSFVVHLVDMQGKDSALFAGIQPRWYSSSSFYYIAPDGVRLFNAVSRVSVLVLPIAGQDNYKLALSPDRSLIAFSVPDAGAVYFYRITGNGLSFMPLKTLNMTGFWVVFSPDGRYAAIQAASGTNSESLTLPSLVVVDLASFSTAGTIPLNDLANDRLFVSDWVD